MVTFILAVIGYLLLAAAYIFDKFILTKSVSRPIVFAFYSTIFLLATIFAVPFGVQALRGLDWVWALVSGVSFGFAVWTIFIALKHGESTHVNPFNGAIVTVFTYIFSLWLFGEALSDNQQIGAGLLVAACLLLSWQKTKGKSQIGQALLWATVSGIFFALSHVTAKYLYGMYPFFTGFIWTRFATGIFGLGLLVHPAVRHVFTHRHSRVQPKTEAKRHTLSLVVTGKVCAVLSTICIQYAISLGSPTVVNALAGLQFLFMFMIIYGFTKFAPQIFQEYFTKKEILIELTAIAFIIAGSACMIL